MPCISEYLRANDRETESSIVASLLIYVFTKLGEKKKITPEIRTAADAYYGKVAKVDEWTALLCSTIRGMTETQLDSILYNGRDNKARSVADWWDRHQEWDRIREAKEKKEKKTKYVKKVSRYECMPSDIFNWAVEYGKTKTVDECTSIFYESIWIGESWCTEYVLSEITYKMSDLDYDEANRDFILAYKILVGFMMDQNVDVLWVHI